MPFMGTDLGKLMKLERLTEDRVQFLVYQMLKGLKVTADTPVYARYSLPVPVLEPRCVFSWADVVRVSSLLSTSTLQGSSTGCVNSDLPDCELCGGGALALFHSRSHSSRFPHRELFSKNPRQDDALSLEFPYWDVLRVQTSLFWLFRPSQQPVARIRFWVAMKKLDKGMLNVCHVHTEWLVLAHCCKAFFRKAASQLQSTKCPYTKKCVSGSKSPVYEYYKFWYLNIIRDYNKTDYLFEIWKNNVYNKRIIT